MNWEAGIFIVAALELIGGVLITLWIRSLDQKISQIASQGSRIEALEDKLEEKTEQIVDARFAMISASFQASLVELKTLVGEMRERLKAGDAAFKEDDQARHKLEIKLVTQIAERCATKDELRELAQRMSSLENTVTRHMAAYRVQG